MATGNPYLDELENDLEKEDGEQDTNYERAQDKSTISYKGSYCGSRRPCTLLTAQITQPRSEAMGLGSMIDSLLVNAEMTLQFRVHVYIYFGCIFWSVLVLLMYVNY